MVAFAGMRALGGMIVLVVVGSAAWAEPAPQPERIQFSYEAPPGCPDDAAFLASVRGRALVTIDPLAERVFAVRIGAAAEGVTRGTLTVTAGTQVTTRDVSASSCTEVADALSMVLALALAEQRRVETAPPVERALPPRWQGGAGGGVTLLERMTPEPLIAVPLFVTYARGRTGPRFRVQLVRTLENEVQMPAGTSAFRWTGGRIDGCPYRFALGLLELAPCIGFTAGALSASGRSVNMPASELRPWAAPELTVRVGVRFAAVVVEVEVGAAAPLIRDHYYLTPETSVYQVPRVTTAVGTSIAIEFF